MSENMDNIKKTAAEESLGAKSASSDDLSEKLDAIRLGIDLMAKKIHNSASASAPAVPAPAVPTPATASAPAPAPAPAPTAVQPTAKKEKSSGNRPPFAAPNLPKPVRQSYVAQGYGTEALADVAERAKEILSAKFGHFSSGSGAQIGGTAARTAAKGFGDSFAGVAIAFRDLKQGIRNKSPRSAALLDKIGENAGETAKTIGHKVKNAGVEAGSKLKDLKNSGEIENAKAKISQSTAAAGRVISGGAKGVGQGLKKATHSTGELLVEMKDKAAAKLEEHRDAVKGSGNLKNPSDSAAPFAAPNLPKPVRQTYVAQGLGIEGLADAALRAKEILSEKINRFSGSSGTSEFRENAGEKFKKFTGEFSSRAKALTDKARAKAESFYDSSAPSAKSGEGLAGKLNGIKDKVAQTARDLAGQAKDKIETMRSAAADSGTKSAHNVAEKLSGIKDKVAQSARDLAGQAKDKIETMRGASAEVPTVEETPAHQSVQPEPQPAPIAEQPAVQAQPVQQPQPEEDENAQYFAQDSVDAEAFRRALRDDDGKSD